MTEVQCLTKISFHDDTALLFILCEITYRCPVLVNLDARVFTSEFNGDCVSSTFRVGSIPHHYLSGVIRIGHRLLVEIHVICTT